MGDASYTGDRPVIAQKVGRTIGLLYK